MSDVATIRQAIIEDYRVDASGAADEHLNRGIFQALADLRPFEEHINQGEFTFDTIVDQASYGIATGKSGDPTANLLPFDFRGILGQYLRFDYDKTDTDFPLYEATLSQFDPAAWRTSDLSGRPVWYMFYQNELWLGPRVPDTISEVGGRYLKDLETPVLKYVDPNWTYIGADGLAITVDAFTNAWFTIAPDVLTSRAAWQYFTRHDRDATAAGAANSDYEASMSVLKRNRMHRLTMGRIAPFLGGQPANPVGNFYSGRFRGGF